MESNVNGCRQSEHCEQHFIAIHAKLDRLDEAIRGAPANGSRPGILVRIDRLEQSAKRQAKLLWLIIGAVISAAATGAVIWISS